MPSHSRRKGASLSRLGVGSDPANDGLQLLGYQHTLIEVARLTSVPECSVFAKFVCCPSQAAEVEDAATEDDSRGAVAPAKDERAQRNSHRSDERIDEEYLLLMRTEVISFRKNYDIEDHVDHQKAERGGCE